MVAKYIRPDTNEKILKTIKKIVIEYDEVVKECDLIDLLISIGLNYITKKDIEDLIDRVER